MGFLSNMKNILNKKKYLFSDDMVNKILNSIYCKDEVDRNLVSFEEEDIDLLLEMMEYLNINQNSNISESFYNEFSDKCDDKEIEFYIYFLYLYMRWTCDKNIFTDVFLSNVNQLFYLNDVEYIYNPDKFKLHYSKPFLDGVGIDEDVSLNLISYVKNNLPDTLDNDLEKAIGIYILLSKVLTYSPIYTLNEEYDETTPYQDVTLNNTDVVCVQFSIIYHKLLTMFGIESNLAGDLNTHMYVNLGYGNMMIRADATRYGYFEDKFNLSDMTNLKFNFLIEGFRIFPIYYGDPSYVPFCESRLNDIIVKVYNKMGIPLDLKDKLSEYIYKIQNSEFGIGNRVNKEEIDRRVSFLNVLPLINNGTVEETQFYNMMTLGIFFDIAEERVENVSFYKNVDGKVILNKMLVVYDEDMKPYYYFFRDGKLVNYDINNIVDIILNEGWLFKYQTDIDALYLDDDQVKKLIR